MNIELRKLRHLVVLADELNFARAAVKVNLTQSALSRSIQTLEAELGGTLFDRDLRNVSLTPMGRQVLRRAQGLLQDASNLQREVDLMRNKEFGDVAFGTGPFPGGTFLPPILAELAREYPQLRVEVEINNWQNLTQHLFDEHIEFFIADVRSVPKNRRLAITRLSRQYGGFFCRTGHPLAGRPLLKQSQVLDYPLSCVRLPTEIHSQLGQYLGIDDVSEWSTNLSCDNPALLQYVTLHSDAIMLSTLAAVSDAIASGALIALDMPNQPKFYADIGVVSLVGRTLSPAAEWLVEKMRIHANQMSAEFPPASPPTSQAAAPAARKRRKS